jgi:hypothetical protein
MPGNTTVLDWWDVSGRTSYVLPEIYDLGCCIMHYIVALEMVKLMPNPMHFYLAALHVCLKLENDVNLIITFSFT